MPGNPTAQQEVKEHRLETQEHRTGADDPEVTKPSFQRPDIEKPEIERPDADGHPGTALEHPG